MHKFENYIPEYDIPLKSVLPCLEYDVAVFCDCLKWIIPMPLPKYLRKFSECLIYYSNRVDELKPDTFPEAYRVYIMDYRLNILFAALDTTGKIATYFSKYGKYAHDIEDYCYGDGELIGDAIFPQMSYDSKSLLSFEKRYGFMPVDELSMASALVFQNEELLERRQISQFQTALLMEKFRSKNLIDWKSLVSRAKEDFGF